jgi:hypothetical protein
VQEETARWSSGSSLHSIASGHQFRQVAGEPLSTADLKESANQVAHHVM